MGTITLPSVRISKRLWFYLKKIQEKRMFSSTTELIRDALREYVERHKDLFSAEEFNILESLAIMEEEKDIEARRERYLLKLADKFRTGH